MSQTSVRIRGLDRFRSTLRKAVGGIGDLKAGNDAAGTIISREGAARAPRRTGRLAGSMSVERSAGRVRISSALAYAGVIHYGWRAHNIEPDRFLTGAAAGTEAQWLAAYDADAQKVLDTVKGA